MKPKDITFSRNMVPELRQKSKSEQDSYLKVDLASKLRKSKFPDDQFFSKVKVREQTKKGDNVSLKLKSIIENQVDSYEDICLLKVYIK